jgi:hypothetical protein
VYGHDEVLLPRGLYDLVVDLNFAWAFNTYAGNGDI